MHNISVFPKVKQNLFKLAKNYTNDDLIAAIQKEQKSFYLTYRKTFL